MRPGVLEYGKHLEITVLEPQKQYDMFYRITPNMHAAFYQWFNHIMMNTSVRMAYYLYNYIINLPFDT